MLIFTFDDFPCQESSEACDHKDVNEKILTQLRKHHIQAVVFANAGKMVVDLDYYKEILRGWLRDGHDVGNHTFSHPSLSKTDVFTYKLDIINGEPIIKKILKEFNKKLEYFRYPYLDYGSGNVMKEIAKFLKTRGYKVMSITIDTLDWKYNSLLCNKLKTMHEDYRLPTTSADSPDGVAQCSDEIRNIEREYIAHIKLMLQKNVNKKEKDIILFHVNLINSRCIGEIIKCAKDVGYKF
jgi:peptidoglycan/xylan/chitin deacetylase (PgdA/CDA1 family)